MPKTTSFAYLIIPIGTSFGASSNIFCQQIYHFYSVFCDKLDKTCSNCYYYTSCILSLMKLLKVVACTKIDAEKQPYLCINDVFMEGEKQKLN